MKSEAAGVLLHLELHFSRHNNLVRSQSQRIGSFVRRSREENNIRAERVAEFQRHVPQAAEPLLLPPSVLFAHSSGAEESM